MDRWRHQHLPHVVKHEFKFGLTALTLTVPTYTRPEVTLKVLPYGSAQVLFAPAVPDAEAAPQAGSVEVEEVEMVVEVVMLE